MTRKLCVDIYNLICDRIGDLEEKRDAALDVMSQNRGNWEYDPFLDGARTAADCQLEIRRLEAVRKTFEEEVEYTDSSGKEENDE